jgi:hypothetical protein
MCGGQKIMSCNMGEGGGNRTLGHGIKSALLYR